MQQLKLLRRRVTWPQSDPKEHMLEAALASSPTQLTSAMILTHLFTVPPNTTENIGDNGPRSSP